MTIRPATTGDREAINAVLRDAFPAEEREAIVDLAERLAMSPSREETLSLVAFVDEDLCGYIAFSRLKLTDDEDWQGYILSPLAVSPGRQRQGIGAGLIRRGVEELAKHAVQWLFVYGDPAYYGRFDFDSALAAHYPAPYELAYPFGWQALRLNDTGASSPGQLVCVAALRDPTLW